MKMNLVDYQKKKEAIRSAIVNEEKTFRVLCYQCLRPTKSCFCHSIAPFETNVDIRILMHPMEAKEHVGTGRLASICLTNSKIHVGIKFDQDKEVQALINDPDVNCMVLYPGEESHNISREPLDVIGLSKKFVVFVIDATWPHAKLMMRENKQFHTMPRISFDPPGTSKFSIKHQPSKYCLCTIESLYHLIDGLGSHGHEDLHNKHVELMKTLKKLVDYQIECSKNPELSSYRAKGSYKSPEERVVSEKWKSRAICFDQKNYHKPL
jgi:DTW domain-containing protein